MTDIVLDAAAWEGVSEGTEALVDAWLAKEGEHVAAGQTVVKIVLVKTTIEVAAPVTGTLARIRVPAEQTFAQGAVLGTVQAD